ncbi:MAG: hypothetical protein ACLFNQ_00350 [Spirochaetaceae bacterium]
MKTVAEFDQLMNESAMIRRTMVGYYLINTIRPTQFEFLTRILNVLRKAPRDTNGLLQLQGTHNRTIFVNDRYETSELEKDVFFFEHGEAEFRTYLSQLHPGFGEELKQVCDFLGSEPYDALFTDRDGTVNNYCGRYRSSVQSAYNAIYLSRFGKTVRQTPVILTSAPLMETGIRELSVFPEAIYALAGSKGGEYIRPEGGPFSRTMPEKLADAMTSLNARIVDLLEEPGNRIFTQIGSGFQKKLGEITLARQDVFGSVPEEDSMRLLTAVHTIVADLNKEGHHILVEDTGRDLELIPTLDDRKGYNKGDGLRFLVDELGLRIAGKRVLICGDTASDVPMLEAARDMGGEVTAVFVTGDKDLRKMVYDTGARCEFVSTPDVLVAGLDRVSSGG